MQSVAFFNHKGGVGKTTVVFNVGVALAQAGYRILLVDADPQANLTAISVDEEAAEQLLVDERTIWSQLAPLVSGAGDVVVQDPLQLRDRVWIVPGDLRLSNFEAITPDGWTESLAGRTRGFRVTSALHRLVKAAGESVGAELIFVDLGPNISAMNGIALLSTDGFVIPMAPDLFSVRALPSVGVNARRWIREWSTALSLLRDHEDSDLDFEIPDGRPAPLGYVTQQFSVYRSQPAEAFRRWLDQIPDAYEEGVIEPLRTEIELGRHDPALGTLPNLGALVPTAQAVNKAVFELSGDEARGAHYTKAQETFGLFRDIGTEIARRVGWE